MTAEDETLLEQIIIAWEGLREQEIDKGCNELAEEFYNKALLLLKSLKLQPQWKPSDEQMEALDFAKAYLCDIKMRGAAEELYYDLKKLKEE